MAGKHSAGGSARKPKTILLTVICLVVFAVLVGTLVWWRHARAMPVTGEPDRFHEQEIAVTEAEEPVAPEDREEEDVPLPGEEKTAGEEAPVTATEMPGEAAGEVEEIQITGDIAPEDEVLNTGEESMSEEDVLAGGPAAQEAEIVLRLEPGAGQSRHVYVQHNPGGMSTTEFLAEGDTIVALAESTYASVAGLDDTTVESLALGFTMTEVPESYAGEAELFWERQGDWLVMVTVLTNLDDPEKLEAFGDLGLMRIVQGDSYTLSEGEAFLLGLGYEKQ